MLRLKIVILKYHEERWLLISSQEVVGENERIRHYDSNMHTFQVRTFLPVSSLKRLGHRVDHAAVSVAEVKVSKFLFLLRVQPTRCNFSLFIYFCKTLSMFQTGFPSIIRSSKLHVQRQAFVKPLLLPAASLVSLAAGSSNGLTNAWRCMCSFELVMMDGKMSETCRASYINK